VEVKASSASRAISALITETSTAKRKMAPAAPNASKAVPEIPESKAQSKPNSKEPIVKSEETNKDNLAIFDFTDSSPADTAINPRTRINELAKAARNARRHSAVPAASVMPEERKPEGALPSLHKRTVSGSVKSSSTTNLAKSTNVTRLNGGVKDKKVTLPPSGSSIDLKAAAEEERKTSALRAERAASRRKSMIL
jgi:hypothetical protein